MFVFNIVLFIQLKLLQQYQIDPKDNISTVVY